MNCERYTHPHYHRRRFFNGVAFLNNTTAFRNYICLMGRCFFSIRFHAAWETPCVAHVARGLRKCQGRSIRFSNFIRTPLLLLRITEHDSAGSEFAQAAFFSFLFPIRAPLRLFPPDELTRRIPWRPASPSLARL